VKPSRCGWCIDGRHDHCIVLVEMGVKQMNGTKKYQHAMPKSKFITPYFWRCGCECERSLAAKCVDCQRVGVEVVGNRCVVDCSGIKPRVQPKVKGDY
jgi:hypothetical protein